ncbi:hypothetical protein [Azonexus fungiphilus]|uniref:hypothetical protein n=1 Tax=Azonexus fungiphilus TaxID=146940 RepID=UPI00156B3AEB|nr:hypothetical protein [Azonexus fungiphilus]NHC07545.1 hypothetical protein [Azonexus fungiphilus]
MVFFIRLLAGFVGVIPPVIALRFNSSADYGHVSVLFAHVLIVLGPLFQYLNQGYLRNLSSATKIKGDILIVYYLIFGLSVLVFISTDWYSALYFLVMMILCFLLKILEVRLLATERKIAAVLICYVSPYFIYSLILVSAIYFVSQGWRDIALFQTFSWLMACGLAVFFLGIKETFKIFSEIFSDGFRISFKGWVFYFNGIILSSLENLPVIFLGLRGGNAIIPSFEVIKKIFSVISVMVQGLTMVHNTSLYKFAFIDENLFKTEFSRLRKSIFLACLLYFVSLCVFIYLAEGYIKEYRFDGDVHFFIFIGLSSLITAIFSAYGSGLTAMHGEKWWTAGAISGLLAFFITLMINEDIKYIATAIFVQNLVLSAAVFVGYHNNFSKWRKG